MHDIVPQEYRAVTFSRRIFEAPPFAAARRHCAAHNADLAVPNGPGLGDIVCFSRLVEDVSRALGRPISLLTAPMNLHYGAHSRDGDNPVWENNPFVRTMIDPGPEAMAEIIIEKDNHFQYGHVLQNMGFHYGVPPSCLRPSLFLSSAEMAWAIKALSGFLRPVICLHPSGVTSSPEGTPWHLRRWRTLVRRYHRRVTFIQLGRKDYRFKELQTCFIETSIREAFALIWAADAFIGFDSGLAHVATAFEKPAMVLWDAAHKAPIEECKQPGFSFAAMARWGYPQNRNILLLGEKRNEVVDIIGDFIKTFNSGAHLRLFDG
ncbi:glycosyltransferase family 9 protein [Nitratidesulfovibrio sp.]|uniref:glycosyltransferase family 9 protein n=1 Tax=Nitratidesulfovibrio sp. TaxID=2802297 RepID=UPI0033400A5D